MIVKSDTVLAKQVQKNNSLQQDSLLDQSVALQSYMQELLNEVSWVEPGATEEVIATQVSNALPAQVKVASTISPIESEPCASTHLQTLAELEEELDCDKTSLLEENSKPSFEVSIHTSVPAERVEEIGSGEESELTNEVNIPAWAGTSFRALYAKHGNLKLVMPLMHVQTVLKAKELVPVEGPLSAFVGYVQVGAQRIPVLDLNSLNSGAEKIEADAITSSDKGYVAIAEDHAVGLYFTEIDDTYEVDSNVVNWCCNDSMVWIAGIDSQNLSIIVDFNRLCDLL
ncbi:hypothetical protein MNBD_GAMMA12-3019 [hydrothermal vent metagenome]|uniref:CheW-like domain-containing protein n=1 Tax=hydrothermal vent metagenome TaxID=652676 RepID=A0A3B0YCY1_9ZZZZ